MRLRSFMITLALGAIILSSSASTGQRGSAQGVVVAVGWQDGTLLLETPEGFPLLVLDVAVNIRDPLGILGVLGDFSTASTVAHQRAESLDMLRCVLLRRLSSPRP